RSHHAKPCVREDDVELAPPAHGFGDRSLQIVVASDIGADDQRSRGSRFSDSDPKLLEQFLAASSQRQPRAHSAELDAELSADSRRGPGNQDGFVAKELCRSAHFSILRCRGGVYATARVDSIPGGSAYGWLRAIRKRR